VSLDIDDESMHILDLEHRRYLIRSMMHVYGENYMIGRKKPRVGPATSSP